MVEAGSKSKGGKKAKKINTDKGEEEALVDGAMITSLCWVSRGVAKAQIDEDEEMEQKMAGHSKTLNKLAK